jgi:ketosteroid isomerase-like protein
MTQENVEIVRRCWAGLEQRPMELHLESFDPEVELRNPPEFPLRGPFRGHDGVRQWANEIWEVFTDLHNEIDEIVEIDDETIVSVQRTQARMRHTQLPADTKWATVWRFKDGRVWRGEGYWTRAEALEAAGLPE